MKSKSWFSRFDVLVGASFFVLAAGCAAHKAPPPSQALTSASVETKPLPNPPAIPVVVVVPPAVNLSNELAAACQVKFNDTASAPKFDFDQSQLAGMDDDVLSQIAQCVTTGPLAGRALDLVGRADPRGGGTYNMALGNRRATSVRDYLAGLGVNGDNLAMTSRGKRDATGTDEAGWQRDRRVDVLLR